MKLTSYIPGLALEDAFRKAKKARGQILDFMATVIAAPRAELSIYAPRIHTMTIPVVTSCIGR